MSVLRDLQSNETKRLNRGESERKDEELDIPKSDGLEKDFYDAFLITKSTDTLTPVCLMSI